MKALLNWIKVQLDQDNTFKNIEIIPSQNFVPDGKGFPCAGILDRGLDNAHKKTQSIQRLSVDIIVYQSIRLSDESSMMGSAVKTGILDLADKVVGYLSALPDGYHDFTYSGHGPSTPLTNDYQRFIVFKALHFKYSRLKT